MGLDDEKIDDPAYRPRAERRPATGAVAVSPIREAAVLWSGVPVSADGEDVVGRDGGVTISVAITSKRILPDVLGLVSPTTTAAVGIAGIVSTFFAARYARMACRISSAFVAARTSL
jgi:hypothetical protein